mmetsp:Transcript_18655/g.42961  ORF Transcript_18655/g.42961 Transcript_18655/m.42961 type:complete len:211 (-) Transcript_18655:230-862(-)
MMILVVAAAAAAAVAPMKDFPPIGRIPRHRLSLLRSLRVGTSPLPPTCHRCPGFPSLKLNSYRHWHRRQSHRISLGWSQSYQPRRWHLLLPLVFPWQLSLPGIRDEEVVAEGEEAWEIVVEPVVFAAAAAAAAARTTMRHHQHHLSSGFLVRWCSLPRGHAKRCKQHRGSPDSTEAGGDWEPLDWWCWRCRCRWCWCCRRFGRSCTPASG